jgi:hypothetical protein
MNHSTRSTPPGLKVAVVLFAAAWLAASAGAAGATKAATVPEGYTKAGFEVLAGYTFVPAELDPSAPPGTPLPSGAKQIPPQVQALHGQKVVVTGYMLPTKMDKGLVKEFLLVSSPMLCCYGATPQVNEFVVVNMGANGVKAVMDTPVQFLGKLAVKEMYEDGFLTNIYSLEGERMGKAGVD